MNEYCPGWRQPIPNLTRFPQFFGWMQMQTFKWTTVGLRLRINQSVGIANCCHVTSSTITAICMSDNRTGRRGFIITEELILTYSGFCHTKKINIVFAYQIISQNSNNGSDQIFRKPHYVFFNLDFVSCHYWSKCNCWNHNKYNVSLCDCIWGLGGADADSIEYAIAIIHGQGPQQGKPQRSMLDCRSFCLIPIKTHRGSGAKNVAISL